MRQPYRIESVTLRDIGVFEHTHFDFPQIVSETEDATKAEIHIFTGPNGCGKSTVLYALAGIFGYASENLSLLNNRFRSNHASVECIINGERAVVSAGESQSNKVVSMKFNDHKNLSPYRTLTKHESWPTIEKTDFAAFAYSGQRANRDKLWTSEIEDITDSPFKDALSFDATVRPAILAKWIANNRAKAALARQDFAEDEAALYDEALSRICQFVKNIANLNVSFKLQRSPLRVKVELEGELIDYEVLPDGLKSIISWIADLALRLESVPWKTQRDIFSQPVILFLDEVDIHLHPKWQRRILPAIQKLLPNAQVFVSTHSPFVVGSVEDAYVYRLPELERNVCRDASVPESVKAIKSGAGKSYQLILAEVFDIDEEFDIETERQLQAFKLAIRQYLQNPQDDARVMTQAQNLSDKSEELATLVSMELRQMTRLLGKK
ncbi:AAA family ATPase [Pseudescherichia vulneris]|uniref:AAA family ATPase n=1 Tax=Pseudescherichia vulneris TaxID=566 RepID=UPI0028D0AB50|nr:AAA family ATPase [Pseudescherichia vulneris]